MTIAATSPSPSARPAGGSSNVKNRSPPPSTRSEVEDRASSMAVFRRSRSAAERSSSTGYWTRTSATRPSGDTVWVVPSTWGRSSRAVRTCLRSASAAASDQRPRVARRAQHDIGGEPCLRRSRAGEELGRSLGVESGSLERVLEVLAEGRGRRHHEHSDHEPGSDHHEGAAGGEPAQPVQYLRHGGSPSTSGPLVALDRVAPPSWGEGLGHIGTEARVVPCLRPGRLSLSASTGPRAGA